ncbi:unnamed protein product [Effrenium voratum]|nr:unnamed protein product [Effrenium voratum]
MIKAFSRKQTVPALSSCEAELIAAVDLAKEALSAGMLVQTILDGVSCSPLGEPLVQVTNFSLTFYFDSQSGIDVAHMSGLLRQVKFEKYELKTRYNLLVDSINRAILLGD